MLLGECIANAFSILQYDSLNRLTSVNYGNGAAISYTYDAAGNRLTYSGSTNTDNSAPSIAITSPTVTATYLTTSTSLTLAGTASDNVGVVGVTWTNAAGGYGNAVGTSSWSAGPITVVSGTNVINVSAVDASGNVGHAQLKVIVVAGSGAATNTVFQDNFNDNTIDSTKWTTAGNTVSESGQMMQVQTTVTDAGGSLTSTGFPANATGKITITRRAFLHYGNAYFIGNFDIGIGTLPHFSVQYANMTYNGAPFMARSGFFLGRNNAWSHNLADQADISPVITPVWDTWFNEKITYAPLTGIMEYFINNVSQATYNVGVLPATPAPMMTIRFTAWGWNTGHQQLFDDLLIQQEGPAQVGVLDLSGDLAFGNVTTGSTAQRTLTIINGGNSGLTVSNINYPAGFSGAWTGSIAAGNSTNVTVTFAPITATNYNGMVSVNTDANIGANTIGVSGTGVPPSGSLQMAITPDAAVSAGARWQVDSGVWQTNGSTVAGLSVGSHPVHFNTVSGWTAPIDQTLIVSNGVTTAATGLYVIQMATVGVQANPPVGGSVAGNGSYQVGTNVQVAATANSCWSFTGWNDGITNTPRTVTVSAGGAAYTGNFSQISYVINTSSSPVGGGLTSGGGSKICGSSVTVVATAATCYQFVNWTEAGNVVSTAASYQFTAGASRTLVANFQQISYTITASASPVGGGTTSGDGSKPCGSSVTVVATPATCYQFVNWTEGGTVVSTAASYQFTTSASRTLVANFQQQTGVITLRASPTTGGSVSSGNSYPCGSSQQISAIANSCWSFIGWSDGNTNNPRTITVPASGATYTANFQQQTGVVTVQGSPVSGGTVSGSGSYLCGASQQISASTNSGWRFTGWSDGTTDNPRTIVVSPGDATYTATFQHLPVKITVQASPSIAGVVNGDGTYPVGSSQTISATARNGWMFVGWDDGVVDNPRTVPVPASDWTYTAYFQSLLDYVKFTETYQDKIGCDASKNCGTYQTGTFTINAVLFTGQGLTAASFDGDTPVEITIGNWTYLGANNTLSDDPKYRAKAGRATLPVTYDANGKTKSAGSVILGFGKKNATLTISIKAGQDAQYNDMQGFVDADTFTGTADPGKTRAVSDTVTGTISIGDYSESFTNIVVTGTDAVKNSKAKDGNAYSLDTVKIKGASH